MRVTIVSRIFAPEISAASGLLVSWAKEFRDRGHDVTVVTTAPPPDTDITDLVGIKVRRAPVLRDRQQYVRGYLSYMSFDIPLAFRLLFARRADLYVVEPPPTSVAVVRVIAALRRSKYVVDAADIWSDAAAMATNSRFVLAALRCVERFALRGSARNLVVDEVYAERMRELGIASPTTVVGFGADTEVFRYRQEPLSEVPTFIYAGTYSEWHGAAVFIEAFADLLTDHPEAKLLFIGNGQERKHLVTLAAERGVSHAVQVLGPVAPEKLVPLLARATASLASLKPHGYPYAFTTKIYSSLAVGCPVIYAGGGPTAPFFHRATNSDAGVAVEYDVAAVRRAMAEFAQSPLVPEARERLSAWAESHYSLSTMAKKVVDTSLASVGNRIDRATETSRDKK